MMKAFTMEATLINFREEKISTQVCEEKRNPNHPRLASPAPHVSEQKVPAGRGGREPQTGSKASRTRLDSEKGHQSRGFFMDRSVLLVTGNNGTDRGALEGESRSRKERALLLPTVRPCKKINIVRFLDEIF